MDIQSITAPSAARISSQPVVRVRPTDAQTAVQATPPVAVPADANAIKQAAVELNNMLKSLTSAIEFTVDTRSEKIVVHIVDSETNEEIRQIPSEEMMTLARSIERMSSLLIKSKA